MLRRSFIAMAMAWAGQGFATHIIGGELYYDHLSGNQYQVTLKLYRDCGSNNTNGTGFDPSAEIGVFNAAGAYLFSEFFTFPGAVTVPVNVNNPCLTVPPIVCVEVASYTGVINLPPGTGGYVLSYQRCCRTPSILNLNSPSSQGLTCTVKVPDTNQTGANSSPHFAFYPPIALCAATSMSFDHSAVDADGDQLVYDLCDPFQGGDQFNPMPSPPSAPPYTPVLWGPGFSTAFQMTGSPGLAIDATTGQLTVTPTQIGSFTVAVRVREFRSGVLLSEVRRDLKFDVVPCQLNVVSAIQQQQNLCTGLTVGPVNQSVNGTTYHWDFGDPNTTADTSNAISPTYTYSDTGTFAVTLIANPGLSCADTSVALYQIHLPLAPQFVPPPITCFDEQPMEVDAVGNFTSAADVQWDLGPAGVNTVVMGDPGWIAFTQPGVFPVTVHVGQFGCTDTFTADVEVHPRPVALFVGDTAGCTPLNFQFTDLSTAWTPLSRRWDFGDGAGGPTGQHMYTEAGVYDVRLTVWTTSGCIDTVYHVITDAIDAWPQPRAGLMVTPPSVNILEPTVLVADASAGSVNWTYWVEDDVVHDPQFLHTFNNGGYFTITQVVSSEQACLDTAYATVLVVDHLFFAPNAFTPNGDGYNDVFLPSVRGAREYELQIYDRWGQPIFHTSSTTEGWDGAAAPVGVYAFRVKIVTNGAANREYVGHVTLTR